MGRDVDQTRFRAECHWRPIVPAKKSRHSEPWLSGLGIKGVRFDTGSSGFQINAVCPVERDIGIGREQFAVRPVEHIKKAVLWRLHQNFAFYAANFEVGQNHMLGRGVIPLIAGRRLIVPDIFPGIGAQSENRGEKEVIPSPR